MDANEELGPEKLRSTMAFLEPWDVAANGEPFFRSAALEGFQAQNFSWRDYSVVITNARPVKSEFTLDRHGFAYLDGATITPSLLEALRSGDRDLVESTYYPQVEALIKERTGCSRVIVFDHTTRKRDPSLARGSNPNGKEQPATVVHCDQGPRGAVRRLKQNLPAGENADKLLTEGRVQMLNVWRPLRPVEEWPLAQLDFTSLANKAKHPCDLWRGDWEDRGQTMTFEYGEDQRWYYLDRHQTDEVTLLKIWDSWSQNGIADCCPHAAFEHPNTKEAAELRESVEVRCLVVYDQVDKMGLPIG